MKNDELLSKTISLLRFPLIVGVVFIHNIMGQIDIQGVTVSYDSRPWLAYTMIFFGNVLPAIAVPLFFFFSGFLFFYKTDFTMTVYKKKLKSRFHTLLIPYMIWNFIGFLILLIQMHPRFHTLFPLLKDYRIDLPEFLSYFWMKELPMDLPGEHVKPINYPLWFIRDLILLVVATPVIYWLIRKFRFLFVALMGIVWFFCLGRYVGLPSLCHQSVFFFPLGAYFSINHVNFVTWSRKVKWSPYIYLLLLVADTMSKGTPYNFWIHNVGILIGMLTAVYIASLLVGKYKIKASEFLSNASFFVFAIHGLFITKLMKAIMMVVRPESPYLVLFIYFFVPVVTILIGLGIYKVLSRWMPSVAKVVTGGR